MSIKIESMPIKNQEYIVDIIDVASNGDGICRLESNFIVFVPNSVTLDKIKIKILKVLKNYGYAKIQEILVESPYRIKPDCDVYSRCGGCSFRHIKYDYELSLKNKIVLDAFSKIGRISTTINNIKSSPLKDRYRNKSQMPVGLDVKSRAISGFYSKRSHTIVEASDCKLQSLQFQSIIKDILYYFNLYGIYIYEEATGRGLIRNIYLREAISTGEIMVCIVSTSANIKNIEKIVEDLILKYKQIKSFLININSKKTNVILGKDNIILYGKDHIIDNICGVDIKISPNSFYQVNKKQAENIYTKAIEYAQLSGKEVLLDLYCGTGTIGLIASKYAKKVLGVEVVKVAVDDAVNNAKLNSISNIDFICSDSKKVVRSLVDKKITVDVVMLDPPRKGCDVEVLSSILHMSPKRIVMISCNPSTAARDCKYLTENGYEVLEISPFDMFPRTNHVESVVLISRVEK